jgi:hypothetical protein
VPVWEGNLGLARQGRRPCTSRPSAWWSRVRADLLVGRRVRSSSSRARAGPFQAWPCSDEAELRSSCPCSLAERPPAAWCCNPDGRRGAWTGPKLARRSTRGPGPSSPAQKRTLARAAGRERAEEEKARMVLSEPCISIDGQLSQPWRLHGYATLRERGSLLRHPSARDAVWAAQLRASVDEVRARGHLRRVRRTSARTNFGWVQWPGRRRCERWGDAPGLTGWPPVGPSRGRQALPRHGDRGPRLPSIGRGPLTSAGRL